MPKKPKKKSSSSTNKKERVIPVRDILNPGASSGLSSAQALKQLTELTHSIDPLIQTSREIEQAMGGIDLARNVALASDTQATQAIERAMGGPGLSQSIALATTDRVSEAIERAMEADLSRSLYPLELSPKMRALSAASSLADKVSSINDKWSKAIEPLGALGVFGEVNRSGEAIANILGSNHHTEFGVLDSHLRGDLSKILGPLETESHLGIKSLASALGTNFFGISKPNNAINQSVYGTSLNTGPFSSFFERLDGPFSKLSYKVGRALERDQTVRTVLKLEWIPHQTMPFEKLEKLSSEEEYDAFILSHYSENFSKLKQTILATFKAVSNDTLGLTKLLEALEHHQNGHYNSSISILVLDFERIFRENTSDKLQGKHRPQRYKNEFCDRHENLDHNFNKAYLYNIVSILRHHILARIDPSCEEEIKKLEAHGIPNRNAVAHSFIHYVRPKQSLNSIFLIHAIAELMHSRRNGLDISHDAA